ncbi:DDB1- and CUL4-associated factor 12 homolog isoform X1 [Daphnia carinata]|uniref:DDB1- and CUL4-associated factor 12 homolog isoform X1 n=1 Tax=Daphnia carinata TaxID=120202 RepID=UPI00257B3188|nr:DDB1- and CUL4-associated factor 12 homolog isoform X1 [Daphnia carinata]
MARVVKKAVYGTLPSHSRVQLLQREPTSRNSQHNSITSEREDSQSETSSSSGNSSVECSPRRKDEFLRYEDSDEEETYTTSSKISHSFVDLVSQRSLGHGHPASVNLEYGTRHLLTNGNLREHTTHLGEMNKIFCSQWLNGHQIVFGSKCNKLSVYDLNKKELFSIPLLTSLQNRQPESQCGIHALAINPSQSVLATGAENTNDIAFYSLPTFDPLAIGEGAHGDWMFDLKWLDDCFLVSGSRDTTMALWKLEDANNPTVTNFKALAVKRCKTAEKVRALAFNKRDVEIAALSLNGYIHLWKADTFKQMGSQKLHHGTENVCLGYHDERNLYAVGSRSHTTVLDARSLQPIQNKNIASPYPTCGIRSVSFRGDILTIGTGTGSILFYDLRSSKYMLFKDTTKEIVFKTSTGWVAADDSPQAMARYTPAIYTHCYDSSGTRLFAAGGPLAVERRGNYASVWS